MSSIRLAGIFLVCSICTMMLSGCGVWFSHETKARNLPGKTEVGISIGDSRQKVLATLEKPLIEARNLHLDVFLQSGRDVTIGWLLAPWIPFPEVDDNVFAAAMIAYDENDQVREISKGIAEKNLAYFLLRVTANDYVFINSFNKEPPDTLLAPGTSWGNIQNQPPLNGQCRLILVMGDCLMERILLDGEDLVDLSPASLTSQFSNLDATFIPKDIPPGHHQLKVHQESWRGDFDADFDCAPGEIIYAELDAHLVRDWWSKHFEGRIEIGNQEPNLATRKNRLRQILWHRGTWQ